MLNPWASETSLKVLKAKITCIPRLDVTKALDGGLHTNTLKNISPCEGNHIQQRVYERLAKLTNLEELCLGHEMNAKKYPHPAHKVTTVEDYQYECLEMTLESGLDQLKGLTNL
ncbi:hypothetical protein CPB97_002688 [Podila verticillata]|nr:hypothetical protein CPB97_002688 [Podila verticillata]